MESDVEKTEGRLAKYLDSLVRGAEVSRCVRVNLRLKQKHTERVRALTRVLSIRLALDDRLTVLAECAALLHDVGRFPQLLQYGAYRDEISVDHGALGSRIIDEAGLLDDLPEEDARALATAVRHHNKLALPSSLCQKTCTISAVLRDADKIDIIRIAVEYHKAGGIGPTALWFSDVSFKPRCCQQVLAALLEGRAVPIGLIATVYDEFLLHLSWIDSLHYAVAVEHLVKTGHVEYMLRSLPDKSVASRVTEYIMGRISHRT